MQNWKMQITKKKIIYLKKNLEVLKKPLKFFQLKMFETETHDYCDRHNYVLKVYCKSNLAVSKSLFGDKMWTPK